MNRLVSEKILFFTGKNKDLTQLAQQIVSQLSSDGYKTQMATLPLRIVIQARKAGILRVIITADRAFSIMISARAKLVLLTTPIIASYQTFNK